MRIEAGKNYIEFEITASNRPNDPSVEFSVSVKSGGFSGYVTWVNFYSSELEAFVTQLEAVERIRKGQAILKEMGSPSLNGAFQMKIFSIDSVGSFCVSVEMQKSSHAGNRSVIISNTLSATFELDPSSLPTILADFKAYLS
jgi:hypothetical protein